jgi:curved DNA binding protein
VSTLCGTIDAFIEEEVTKVFSNKKSKKLERGISFPCTVSINEVCGHFSPCPEDTVALKDGDVAKIELGAHIDGYSCNAATTVIVGGKAEDKKADVVLAAYNAFLAAQRSIRVGGLNQEVTAKIQAVCSEFEVEPLQGVLSHKMKKHLTDGNEVIINKETPEQRVEDWEFAPGDVIALDVYVSSGEGMAREADIRTTVFKRELDMQYNLKSKSARTFFTAVNQKYPTLPFSIRGFEDLTAAKLGVKECLNHDLLMSYPVLTEKPGEIVAQFKCTIAVQPKSCAILAGDLALDVSNLKSQKSIKSEELKELIASELWKADKKKK